MNLPVYQGVASAQGVDTNRLSSDACSDARFNEAALRAECERLEGEAPLATSPRLRELLRYLVQETIAGRAELLSQYRIAFECFGFDASQFDPNESSVIRVNLSRLRKALDALCAGSDSVRITLPPGSYALKLEQHGVATVSFKRPVLALISFRGGGLDGEWSFLPDLLTEQIGDGIAKLHAFEVMGPFRRDLISDHDPDFPALARKHRINCFVDGSIRRRGEHFDMNLRILDGTTGGITWTSSETFSVDHLDFGESAACLVARLARIIGADFGGVDDHFSRICRGRPGHALSVYEAVLLGRMYFADFDPQSFYKAIESLREVVHRFPTEPLPQATLAVLLANAGHEPSWPCLPPAAEIRSLADQAWRLDPRGSWSILARSFACCFNGDSHEILRQANAVEVDSNASTTSLYGLGALLCLQNLDVERGIRFIRRAETMNPYGPCVVAVVEALVALRRGDLEATLANLDRYGVPWGWASPLLRGAVHALRGDLEFAAHEYRAVNAAYPDFARAALEPNRLIWHSDHLQYLVGIYHRVGIGKEA